MSALTRARHGGHDQRPAPDRVQAKARALGLTSATGLVVGSIVGTGVFAMPAVLAGAGTSSLLVLGVIAVGAMPGRWVPRSRPCAASSRRRESLPPSGGSATLERCWRARPARSSAGGKTMGSWHVPVDRHAPLADFEAIASRYPVFRVEREPAASR
jgi:hypothetical protein